MLKETLHELRPAIATLAIFTVLSGATYPLFVTGAAQLLFPHEANGSLIEVNGKVLGSELLAQRFTSRRYFWPRPSAADYNAVASSGSNLAPSNPALVEDVQARVADYRTSDTLATAPVPVDLALASGSGLDPHISIEAALWQVPRVAQARGVDEAEVRRLVEDTKEGRTFGVLGEERVNVLRLNLLLDASR